MKNYINQLIKYSKIIVPLITLSCCIYFAFFIHKDYGLQVDSLSMRSIGGQAAVYAYAKTGYFLLPESKLQSFVEKQSVNYTVTDTIKLEDKFLQSPMRYYGVFYEVILLGGELIFGRDSIKEAFFIRNLMTHFTFIAALVLLFFGLKQYTLNWSFALFTCLLIYLSPRIFADSFYNSKDLPFLSFYLVATISSFYFINNSSNRTATLHGIFSGLVVALRIPGIIVPALTCLLVFILIIFKVYNFKLKHLGIYILTFLVTLYIAYPILWENPLNFIEAFKEMKAYPWDGDILFLSSILKSHELPITYFPVWFFSTTPPIVLFGLLLFPIVFLNDLRKGLKTEKIIGIIILLGLGAGPIMAIILLNSNLYDAWRQVFFVYPSFVLLSVYSLSCFLKILIRKNEHRNIITSVTSIAVILQLLSINYELHPYQNIYFNNFAVQPIKKNYELDYWGLSFREGFEYVLKNDKEAKILTYVNRFSGKETWFGLTNEQKERLIIEDNLDKAKYFVYSFRATLDEKEYFREKGIDYDQEVFRVERNGLILLRVFKLNPKN